MQAADFFFLQFLIVSDKSTTNSHVNESRQEFSSVCSSGPNLYGG